MSASVFTLLPNLRFPVSTGPWRDSNRLMRPLEEGSEPQTPSPWRRTWRGCLECGLQVECHVRRASRRRPSESLRAWMPRWRRRRRGSRGTRAGGRDAWLYPGDAREKGGGFHSTSGKPAAGRKGRRARARGRGAWRGTRALRIDTIQGSNQSVKIKKSPLPNAGYAHGHRHYCAMPGGQRHGYSSVWVRVHSRPLTSHERRLVSPPCAGTPATSTARRKHSDSIMPPVPL